MLSRCWLANHSLLLCDYVFFGDFLTISWYPRARFQRTCFVNARVAHWCYPLPSFFLNEISNNFLSRKIGKLWQVLVISSPMKLYSWYFLISHWRKFLLFLEFASGGRVFLVIASLRLQIDDYFCTDDEFLWRKHLQSVLTNVPLLPEYSGQWKDLFKSFRKVIFQHIISNGISDKKQHFLPLRQLAAEGLEASTTDHDQEIRYTLDGYQIWV